VRYWTSAVFDTDRVGSATRAANQSIKGLLARLGVESTAVWVVLCTALVCLTVVAMRRAVAASRPMWALCLNALGTLPLTPVSWCHHWVWCVPVLLTAAVDAWRTRTAVPIAIGGLLLFVLSPHWWWNPAHEWNIWRLVTGNLYVCFAVLVLVGFVRQRHPDELSHRTSKRPVPAGAETHTSPGGIRTRRFAQPRQPDGCG
jgi:alpha-1,2-mannosyltransferase